MSAKEKRPGLVDALYPKPGLPEISSHSMAIGSLLRETLITLLQSGVLTTEQVEETFSRVENRLAENRQKATDEAESEGERNSLASIFDGADQVTEQARRRVLGTSDAA